MRLQGVFFGFTFFHNMVATIKKKHSVGSQNSPSFEVDGRPLKFGICNVMFELKYYFIFITYF
jgi:hypothetical protein